jgi:hypothetical protein
MSAWTPTVEVLFNEVWFEAAVLSPVPAGINTVFEDGSRAIVPFVEEALRIRPLSESIFDDNHQADGRVGFVDGLNNPVRYPTKFFESGTSSMGELIGDDTTVCPICQEEFDDHSSGSQAPLTPACCGNSVCRACVISFHAAKQDAIKNRIKHFPCLTCNHPKAFNIECLPAPNRGYLRLVTVAKELVKHVSRIDAASQVQQQRPEELLKDLSQQRLKGAPPDNSLTQSAADSRQSQIDTAVGTALAAQARLESTARATAVSDALSKREKTEKVARRLAVSAALEVQKKDMDEDLTAALKAQLVIERQTLEKAVKEAIEGSEAHAAITRDGAVNTAVASALKTQKQQEDARMEEFAEANAAAAKTQAALEATARTEAITDALSLRGNIEKVARRRALQKHENNLNSSLTAALEARKDVELQEREMAVTEAVAATRAQEKVTWSVAVDAAVDLA